jgi:hypothetical protein
MTKIWRKQEWEQQELFPKRPTQYEDPSFKPFVRDMYNANCKERREHGQKEYETLFIYFRKNHRFIVDKFEEEQKEGSSG